MRGAMALIDALEPTLLAEAGNPDLYIQIGDGKDDVYVVIAFEVPHDLVVRQTSPRSIISDIAGAEERGRDGGGGGGGGMSRAHI